MDHDGSVKVKLALGVDGLVRGAGAAWLAANRSFVPHQTADAPLCLVVGWSFIGDVKNIVAILGPAPSADDHRRMPAVLTFLNSR